MDVTVMEPFNVLEAPQIAIQLFNKTITQNSKIRSFKCRRLKIYRSNPGVIHFDGDPKEEGCEIDVCVVPQDIRIVVNTNEQPYLPPLLHTFSDIYNNVNVEFISLKRDLMEGQTRMRRINQELLRRLRNP